MNSILYPIFFFIAIGNLAFSWSYLSGLYESEWFGNSAGKLFGATIILDIVMSNVFYNIHASNLVIGLYDIMLIPMFPIALLLWIDGMMKKLVIITKTWDMPKIRVRRK
ncbi:hypothetical protein ACLIKE_07005 [Ferroplasma acidiphilum]|uniref:Uncharacterized protein n=1 Tax=Ferroplasma acidiphilum TaxID=74969 RepID=A0A7K4FMK4_9ARCH|nr:hypothetical protein [Ferroplasma acidiphilum]NOL60246.1 hypothetical protein [Ferroplasma acidiphilum]